MQNTKYIRRILPIMLILALGLVSCGLFDRSINFAIAVDMTGVATDQQYIDDAKVNVKKILRLARKNDSIKLVRICGYASTIAKVTKIPSKPTDDEVEKYVTAALKPCDHDGSAITEAVKAASYADAIAIFTDGALVNDKQAGKFADVAKGLVSDKTKAVWFAGLSSGESEGRSIRDELVSQLPTDERIITTGTLDSQNGWGQFYQLIRKARQ